MSITSLTLTQKDLELFRKHLEMSSNLSAFNKSQLSKELLNAEIVEECDLPETVVSLNSSVKLLDMESGQEFRFTLVHPSQANIKSKKVSCLAPIGIALFGYRAGDEVKWEMPTGFNVYRILSVSRTENKIPESVQA